MLTVPQFAARTVVPVGAAMSSPLWMWSPRLSPYGLVTVPLETGETIRPSAVQPPLPVETGVDDGAGAVEGAEPDDGAVDGAVPDDGALDGAVLEDGALDGAPSDDGALDGAGADEGVPGDDGTVVEASTLCAAEDDEPRYLTCVRNSSAHVRVSTMPVDASPCESWNCLTAPSVCGPKIPSDRIRSWVCTAATASPVSP